MDQWVAFAGKAIDNGAAWLLEAQDGDGAFAALRVDVRVAEGRVEIRRGAKVRVVRNPQRGGKPASIRVPADECPGGRTKCIGLVTICCDDQRVIGPGFGVWDDCP